MMASTNKRCIRISKEVEKQVLHNDILYIFKTGRGLLVASKLFLLQHQP